MRISYQLGKVDSFEKTCTFSTVYQKTRWISNM